MEHPEAREQIEALEKAEQPVPLEFYPPQLLPGLEEWLEAFWWLHRDRQIGMGVGPIPASSIERHVEGWPEDDARVFRVAMRDMDEVYLAHEAGRSSAPQKGGAPKLSSRALTAEVFDAVFG